jgi:hypothetical protein
VVNWKELIIIYGSEEKEKKYKNYNFFFQNFMHDSYLILSKSA